MAGSILITYAKVFIYTGAGGVLFRNMWSVSWSIHPSIPDQAFAARRKLTEEELCEGLIWKLGGDPSIGATIQ